MYRVNTKKTCENAMQLITNLMRKNHIEKGEDKHETFSSKNEIEMLLLKKFFKAQK